MEKLFDLNNPVMQFLDKAGKLMLLNLLFLVCSIPVVTIGAAIAAMQKVTQGMCMNEDPYIARTFFKAFRDNFKQATMIWLVVLVFAIIMCYSYMVSLAYLAGSTAQFCQWLLLAVAVILLAVMSYLFPLLVRYDNGLNTHLVNAAVLAIGKLPRTIVLTACNAVPFAMIFCPVGLLSKLVILWVLIGFALISYLTSSLLRPVFKEYEGTGQNE